MSDKSIKFPHQCAPVEYDKYLDNVLNTIYRVGKAATSKEIMQRDSSLGNFICIGRACSFLSWVGLVKGERSPFDLTEEGRQIAIAIEQNKPEVVLDTWKRILKAHNLFSELNKYMQAQGGNTGTSLGFAEHLNKLSGKNLDYNFVKESGKRLCALLAGKELLIFDKDQDKISLPSEEQKPPVPPTPPASELPPSQSATVNITTAPQGAQTDVHTTLPCNINISVEAKDPDSIKQVINLIRELTGRKADSS
jgi:hypothetical protein